MSKKTNNAVKSENDAAKSKEISKTEYILYNEKGEPITVKVKYGEEDISDCLRRCFRLKLGNWKYQNT